MTRSHLLYRCKTVMHVSHGMCCDCPRWVPHCLFLDSTAEFKLLQGIIKLLVSACCLRWPDVEERSVNRRTRKT
jgi:hypothetical protein